MKVKYMSRLVWLVAVASTATTATRTARGYGRGRLSNAGEYTRFQMRNVIETARAFLYLWLAARCRMIAIGQLDLFQWNGFVFALRRIAVSK